MVNSYSPADLATDVFEVDLSDSPPASPTEAASAEPSPPPAGKKKKKKRKKAKAASAVDDDDVILAKATLEAKAEAGKRPAKAPPIQPSRPASSLCISRNKHWRHISAYHVSNLSFLCLTLLAFPC